MSYVGVIWFVFLALHLEMIIFTSSKLRYEENV